MVRTSYADPMAESAFSATYLQAREKFLALVADRDAQLVSVVHPTERGAEGEDLAIDVATFGNPDAEKTLFLVSGTHGQEGFLGSALQIAFLHDLEIPDGVNIVALHALNPWGFSHLSRTDEANIDLNRNFNEGASNLIDDELYPSLFRALCPDDWTEETIDWSTIRDEVVREHGFKRMVTVLAGGQIIEPTGLNFVGRGASWSRTVVSELLPQIFAKAKKIAFIEWHTGLGKFAELSHLCSFQPGSPAYERVFGWMGEEARTSFAATFELTAGEAPSYEGLFSAWLPVTAPHAEWTGLLIEVGTYDNITVGDAVRMDRWLRFGSGHSSTPREEMRRMMMDRLNPKEPEWRSRALANGLDAQRRALLGLKTW
ncbi:hypothetical protein CYL20_04145 [Pseudomonas palleroniana]|uniref:DUF2817 domain-containing protein n=2 Tax=Pseudomonas palleroniana TaxID=191390 RepID=A0A2L1J5M9_9PSED|nr:hypothetical protein CYL20_04145 [Pseudomonas palleroniana]